MAKILVIDDSTADTRFMLEALKGLGHTVVTENNPNQAEARVEAEQPSLILLDVVMPERSGYEVLRGLKRLPNAASFKVIFVSSKGGETDVKWGLRQGAVDYIIKPYTPDQVQSIISRHV